MEKLQIALTSIRTTRMCGCPRFLQMGNTPLHYAARAGNVVITKELLGNGAGLDPHNPKVSGKVCVLPERGQGGGRSNSGPRQGSGRAYRTAIRSAWSSLVVAGVDFGAGGCDNGHREPISGRQPPFLPSIRNVGLGRALSRHTLGWPSVASRVLAEAFHSRPQHFLAPIASSPLLVSSAA